MQQTLSRRALFAAAAAASSLPLTLATARAQARKLRVSGLEVFLVDVTEKGNWVFARLQTNQGLTGIGEASHGLPGGARRVEGALKMRSLLGEFFEFVRNESPFDIQQYRNRARSKAAAGQLPSATAFSAIEQALWDLCGKAAGIPVCDFFGGRMRASVPLYANINRATIARTPQAFAANAAAAVAEGFRTLKAAPFDGFPKITADDGVACIEAIRKAAGAETGLYIDCHSNFTVPLAVDVARRLEPVNLGWYEEPVPPQRIDETLAIKKGIRQRMAGGEILFGMEGFQSLCERHAVDVIMPDVKHCGGLFEASRIAALAELHGVEVSPHNPAGPVSTAAGVHLCAGLRNFRVLEFQWGEIPWRSMLVNPPEQIASGSIAVSDAPGFGVELNDNVIRSHAVSVAAG